MDNYVVGFLIIGIMLTFAGFHAIDNAWNMDSGCVDMALNGETLYSRSELYRYGVQQIFMAMMSFMMCCFIPTLRVKKNLKMTKLKNN